jgi:hypothetical protein
MDWISVKERWPDAEQGDKILAYGNGYAFECEFDDGYWTNIGGDDFTHWMPLPPPPTEKGE